jgi:hypothetical protein
MGSRLYEQAIGRSEKATDAAQLLFASLDDRQKSASRENLIRINNERDAK